MCYYKKKYQEDKESSKREKSVSAIGIHHASLLSPICFAFIVDKIISEEKRNGNLNVNTSLIVIKDRII